MASNPNFSLMDPNQQNWMQQGQSGVMAPYQAPAYQAPPVDWGMGDYMQNLDSSALNFGGGGATPGANPQGFQMNWGKMQQGFGMANAALNTVGLVQGILNARKDLKLRKQSSQRGFNANAILANNAIRSKDNAARAYNSGHGIDYKGPHTPLKMIQGWGKSGKGVGT